MVKRIAQAAPAQCHALEVTDEDVLAVGREDLARLTWLLYLVREFETVVLDMKDANLVNGPAHTSVGQEAVAAGMAVALRKTDLVGSTHRAHGHFLAKAMMYYAPTGYQPLREAITSKMQEATNRTLAEIMGLREGWCGGRGGSMHLYDGESGNLGSNAIVGGGIPLATGAAWAQKLQKKDNVVVSFFGDGAINQGCFHEVANMAALWGAPVLYCVENNLYAVGTCVSESSYVCDLAQRSLGYGINSLIVDGMDPVAMFIAMRDAAQQMRAQPFPFFIEAKTYRHYHHAGRMPGSNFRYRSKDEETSWLAKDPTLTFPARLARLGLLSEAERQHLEQAAKQAMAIALNFCTAEEGGKRVIPARNWPDPATAARNVRVEEDALAGVSFKEKADFSSFREMTYVEAIAATTKRNMERDERIIVLGEEVANLNGGAYAATRGIKEVYPERLFNTPISETGFVGISGGAASVGMRPITEVMFPDFALMSSDQLFNQIGKLRHMYGGRITFPLVIRTRIAIGFGYGGQHSMDPSAVFALFSGWRIMAPSNAFDVVGMLNTAVRLNDPVLFLEHGQLYAEKGQVPADTLDYYIPYGKANVVRPGKDVTVLTYLTGVRDCLKAAQALEAEGLSAEVIDLRTLDYQGLDWATIGASVQKTGSVLVVEQAPRSLTLGGRIADEIQERFFDDLDGPIAKVSSPDVPLAVSKALEDAMIPSVAQIQAKMAQGARHQF
jgi:2-oxoisovalerate dehydrogenase E1 component